ncbi:HAMP domain-containing histidine kinase [Enterococcus faecalis]|nr:HAMP domain-containing histidine kinase [Enterococcus faecalis]
MLVIKLLNNFRQKISYKAFATIFSLLFVFTLLIYILLILFFPTFYHDYQLKTINRYVDKVLIAAKTKQEKILEEAIDRFFKQTGNFPIVIDKKNAKIVYAPDNTLESISGVVLQNNEKNQAFAINSIDEESPTYVKKDFLFKNKEYTLTYLQKLQTITDTTQILIQFSPYFLLFAILLSGLVSYIFSRKMVTPLQEMNQVARKMVDLDFQTQVKVTSEDELGQLSANLNNLGVSLKEALVELQNKNQLLASDLERERELEQLRKNFIMAISHELKTPLTSAMGIVEAMKYNIAPYNHREVYLKKTYQILENMACLIQEMLEVSRLEQTVQAMTESKVNLNEQLKKMINDLQNYPKFQQRKITWSLEEPLIIQTKTLVLKKAIQNVLSNAFLYSDGEIAITTKNLENGWYCSIFNTSANIPQKELEKLFEPFYRLEKSRNKQTGGNGLGLFLTKQFLTALNISYVFKNKKNGVVFELWSTKQ